jgi:hypothetical protein
MDRMTAEQSHYGANLVSLEIVTGVVEVGYDC